MKYVREGQSSALSHSDDLDAFSEITNLKSLLKEAQCPPSPVVPKAMPCPALAAYELTFQKTPSGPGHCLPHQVGTCGSELCQPLSQMLPGPERPRGSALAPNQPCPCHLSLPCPWEVEAAQEGHTLQELRPGKDSPTQVPHLGSNPLSANGERQQVMHLGRAPLDRGPVPARREHSRQKKHWVPHRAFGPWVETRSPHHPVLEEDMVL